MRLTAEMTRAELLRKRAPGEGREMMLSPGLSVSQETGLGAGPLLSPTPRPP